MKSFTVAFVVTSSYLYSQNDTAQHKTKRFSLHMQETTVSQFRPAFNAAYTGAHSQTTDQQWATTLTSSIFAGMRLWKNAQAFINPEIAGGAGLSSAYGIAAFSNGEAFRVGSPTPAIYLARGYFKQLFPLSKEEHWQDEGENLLGLRVPTEYISFIAGKISIADYFDNNLFSHNPRTQFMSWGLMSNGAWDYPANTRGYTPSIVVEYVRKHWEARYGISMMPTTANGNKMDGNVAKANASTFELRYKYEVNNREGQISGLAFYNTTHMGSYTAPNLMSTADPLNPGSYITTYDISASRQYGRSKYGFGLNLEQHVTGNLGIFSRASYNDGHNETWAFTEIDRAFSVGAVLQGRRWKRNNDVVGLAWCVSGLSKQHEAYLANGGLGFILGDGRLNYGHEHLIESYYSASLLEGKMFLSLVYQFIANPAYNKDRGPMSIYSVRVHFTI